MRAERCARKLMPRVDMYGGKSLAFSGDGNVVVHGGSFAFCSQPVGGSTVWGSSLNAWVAVHIVFDVSPATMPAQSYGPAGRTGVRPPKTCMMWPARSAYMIV